MTYQVTYETADGTVETFISVQTKARAVKLARQCAKGSAMNAVMGVTRWFAERNDATVATFPVAA